MKRDAMQQLEMRIEQREAGKKRIEERLSSELKIAAETIRHPAPFIKKNLAELAADKKVLSDIIALALHFFTLYMGARTKAGSGQFSFIRDMLSGEQGEKGFSLKDIFQKIAGLFKKGDSDDKQKGTQ